MLGIAMRIAQRAGIHSETANATHAPFDAEMRRRLWWALVLFDARIAEMSDQRTSMLLQTWDCKIPSNVYDCQIQPGMTTSPRPQVRPADSIFIALRCQIADFVRRAKYHINSVNPLLDLLGGEDQRNGHWSTSDLPQLIARHAPEYSEDNGVHMMTMYTSNAAVAKCGLNEYLAQFASHVGHIDERDQAYGLKQALDMLVSTTQVAESVLTEKFTWFSQIYFPFTAYIEICRQLKKRPDHPDAEVIWGIMSSNYEACLAIFRKDDNPFIALFAKIVLRAWAAREVNATSHPFIVSELKRWAAKQETFERLQGENVLTRDMHIDTDFSWTSV
jgi:hypothetical protein